MTGCVGVTFSVWDKYLEHRDTNTNWFGPLVIGIVTQHRRASLILILFGVRRLIHSIITITTFACKKIAITRGNVVMDQVNSHVRCN